MLKGLQGQGPLGMGSADRHVRSSGEKTCGNGPLKWNYYDMILRDPFNTMKNGVGSAGDYHQDHETLFSG
jgi:hypothetical protein